MTRRILLGVLYLSGWLISSTRLHHQYHYVSNEMTWTQAQTYCRQTYTDLATIENTEEMNQVHNLSFAATYSEVWTGLYIEINRTWSDGYTESGVYNRYWASLKYYLGHHWCLNIDRSGLRHYDNCSAEYPLICYRGTQLDPEFVFVNETMSWSSAQSYCREKFIDLVTVRNYNEKLKVNNLVQSENRAWISLNGYFNMSWSDGSGSESFFWNYTHFIHLNTSVECGLIHGFYKTFTLYPCNRRFPFICYSTPQSTAAAVRRQVVKLRMKVEDSSVDLNDAAVKADMLKKLQDRLKEKGVSGVTLKWREQPDGKVFHKEGTDN